MSDGITLYCPKCGNLSALKKEYDELKVRILDEDYLSHIPVYTCQIKECQAKCAIEFVYRKEGAA